VGLAIGGAYNSLFVGAITDSIFTGNSAIASGTNGTAHGGAIFVFGGTLSLNVTANKKSVFEGNTANGVSNSIHLLEMDGMPSQLDVTTEPGGVLYMLDPMTSGPVSFGGEMLPPADTPNIITKSGTGTWKLGGTSVLPNTNVTINAGGGTLHLYGLNEGEAPFSIANFIRADDGTYSSYVFPGKAAGEIPAGRLHLDTGTFTVHSGAKVVLGGTGTAITTTGAGAVTLAAGSSVVFKVLSADASGHGVIQTDNLVIGSGAKLILDLDSTFAVTVAASLADAGTVIPGLFLDASGLPLTAHGQLVNFAISDTKGQFVWGLSDFGGVRVLGANPTFNVGTPTPTPEPATNALFGGLGVLAFAMWRRRCSAARPQIKNGAQRLG
jgi:hypothetical protein